MKFIQGLQKILSMFVVAEQHLCNYVIYHTCCFQVRTTCNNTFFNVQKPFAHWNLSKDQRKFMVNPQSAFNVRENRTENSKVVARMLSINHSGRLLQIKRSKRKLMQSFSAIKKWDYLILCTKWMRCKELFRMSFKKLKYWKICAHCIPHRLAAK